MRNKPHTNSARDAGADASRQAALLVACVTPGMRASRALAGRRLDAHNRQTLFMRGLQVTLRLGCDIDGVLADMESELIRHAKALFGEAAFSLPLQPARRAAVARSFGPPTKPSPRDCERPRGNRDERASGAAALAPRRNHRWILGKSQGIEPGSVERLADSRERATVGSDLPDETARVGRGHGAGDKASAGCRRTASTCPVSSWFRARAAASPMR